MQIEEKSRGLSSRAAEQCVEGYVRQGRQGECRRVGDCEDSESGGHALEGGRIRVVLFFRVSGRTSGV